MPDRTVLMLGLRLVAAALLLCAGAHAARAADDFLEPEQAFKVTARAEGERTVDLSFAVAPGYYLYREQFKFAASGAQLGAPVLPHGKVKFDQTFAKNVETYRDTIHVAVPIEQAGARFQLIATSQGCADAGLCYPPMQSTFEVSLPAFGGSGVVRKIANAEPAPAEAATHPNVSVAAADSSTSVPADTAAPSAAAAALAAITRAPGPAAMTPAGGDAAASTPPSNATAAAAATTTTGASPATAAADSSALGPALRDGRFWPVVGAFFAAGVLLSLTPCVLPMLPIVSSIIAGHGVEVSRGRGLALAAAYSLGMAVVYTALGVAAGLAGEGLAAALQTPWVLGVFALGLVALSLSMFGVYELRPPSGFTERVTRGSQRLPAGRIASVCAMGGVSALIVSPCVAAPLAGALVYLSQTRDVWLGGTALFSLAIGMSVPLLLVGASAGALLPRAGAWMDEVKHFFGLLLLGVALWTVQTVLPAPLVLALWGALAIGAAVLLFGPGRGTAGAAARRLWRPAVAAVLAVIGVLQLVGAASGGTDPLQPLAHLAAPARGATRVADAMPRFAAVRSVAELDAALRASKRPVVLDFYADWCVSCKEMERYTYTDPVVQKKLGGALLLKADVTQNNRDDRALLKRFGLFGPPGTIFFDPAGHEVGAARAIGFQDTGRFLETLRVAGL